MALTDRFVDEVFAIYDRVAAPQMVPAVLVEACATVLPVEGAGLSLTSRLRVPLAASSAMACRAERLQTTLGEGPCLDATDSAMPLVVDVPAMEIAWPMFGHELVAQTPFRSVASIPLGSADRTRLGALDLYSIRPEAGHLRDVVDEVVSITRLLTGILLDPPAGLDGTGQRTFAWLTGASVEDRMNVWIAVGVLLVLGHWSNEDALA